LTALDTRLIPEARDQWEKAKVKAFSNPRIQERLEREIPEQLAEAARIKEWWFSFGRKLEEFESVRDSAQSEFQQVARSQARYFDAELKLAQFEALRNYLLVRARQYATLALRITELVRELEAEAERLRAGAPPELEPPWSVEVFQTLTKPK